MQEGDELIEVNGMPMKGLDVNQVGDMITVMTGDMSFVLASDPTQEMPTPRPLNNDNDAIVVVSHDVGIQVNSSGGGGGTCTVAVVSFQT